jgi:hypothetical protein
MLNYTVESDIGNTCCLRDEDGQRDRSVDTICTSIDVAASGIPAAGSTGFAAIKLTALTPPDFLFNLSEQIIG